MGGIETQVTPRVEPPVTLHVTQSGDLDSSTHLLLVHGYPDDQRMWGPVVAALPGDWHVITYDVRGAGRSSRPARRSDYRTDLLVDDLIAVLEATVPLGERVHLVGHDWGAAAMWDVVAAAGWDPRLENRLATCTSASGPPFDHLAALTSTSTAPTSPRGCVDTFPGGPRSRCSSWSPPGTPSSYRPASRVSRHAAAT